MFCQNYLEELVRLRDSQLAEVHSQRQRLLEKLEYLELKGHRDQSQLESVIIELQSQVYVTVNVSL